jgi:DNA-binding LacI/PurR family transcriptional regulator
MTATLHDVARVAGVSIKTVSNVVNDWPHVSAKTRSRVLAAIDQLGYRPNLSARGLRSGKTGVIGLAVPSLRESYFAELADAVIREAGIRGVHVVVEQTDGDREIELRMLSGGRLRFVDGLLFSPVRIGRHDVDRLRTDAPLVLLGERIFGGPTDHVTMHNTSAARAAVEHLLEIGRTRIALIGSPETPDGDASSAGLRERGYLQALEAAGIAPDPELVVRGGPWERATGAAGIRRLRERGIRFDAVFAMNDTLALGALRALGESGTGVPGEVAVIGFDDIDEGRFSLPSLTTVDPGRLEIARAAVSLLLERIEEKGGGTPPRTVKAAFRIVRRESTGFGADADDASS